MLYKIQIFKTSYKHYYTSTGKQRKKTIDVLIKEYKDINKKNLSCKMIELKKIYRDFDFKFEFIQQ